MKHYAFSLAAFGFLFAELLRAAPEPKLNVPDAIYAPRPHLSYTAIAERGAAGNGLFELRLRPNGTVAAVAVLRSTGHKMVDQQASATFMKWRFRPGARKSIRIPFSFTRV
jgi:TonB family protein